MSNSTLTFYRLTLIMLSLCGIVKMNGDFKFNFDDKRSTSTSIKIRVYYPGDRTKILSLLYFSEGLKKIKIHTSNASYKYDFYTLTDLLPCTTYQIEAELNDKYGQSFVHSENKTTKSQRPTTNIVHITSNSSSAVVWLEFNHFNCIDWLEVDLNRTKSIFFNKLNLTNPYIFYGLDPCSSYEISIKTHFTNNWNNKNHTDTSKMFRTQSVKIGGVENINFNNKSNVLTWDRPREGANCIKGYKIQTKQESGKRVILTGFEDLTITEGCSNYSIMITPKGENASGEHRQYQLISGFKEPGPVENLLVYDRDSTQFTIEWSSSIIQPSCVKQYKILVNGVSDLVDSYNGTYTKRGLEPCTAYNISVCVVAINDQDGKCKEIEVTTTTDIPKEVNGLTYKYDGNSLIVSWNTPRYGANCVKEYNVSLYDIELEKEVYNKIVQYSELHIDQILRPCQMHMLYVTPVNLNGTNGAFNWLKFISRPTNPGRPSKTKMIARTATSLTLTSKYENLDDQCVLTFAYFKCRTVIGSTNYWVNITLDQNQKEFTVKIDGLKDLTNYSCSVRIANSNFLSDESMPIEFETAEKLADPLQVKSESSKSNSFILKWEKPPDTIRLKQYHVIVTKVEKNYVVPDYCIGITYNKSWSFPPNSLNNEISKLEPYTKYSVQMAIENTAGIGPYSNPIEVITALDTPHQVKNFKVVRVNLDQTVELKWDLPCDINGEIQAFKGSFYGSQPPNESVYTFEWKLQITDDNFTYNYYKENRINPAHFYNITIGIEVKNFTGQLNETTVNFTSPAGIPEAHGSSTWARVSKEPSPRDNITLYVSKDLFISTKGKIEKFTFIIFGSSCAEVPKDDYKFFINENDEENSMLPTWFEYENADCTGQYQLKYFNPNEFDVMDTFEFTIGSEHCDSKQNQYCNGPLKLGTQYAVIARVYTQNGYADTKPIYFETETNFGTLIVIVIVLSILFAGFLFGFGIMRFKLRYTNEPQSVSAIPVKSFVEFFANMEFDIIQREYQVINSLDLREYTTDYAKEHKIKNRYANILPYDRNRVILSPTAYSDSDYINASFVDGFKRQQEYIATQGPKEETCYDFWTMVIETKCHKIVMVTKLIENTITKCFQYYPDAGMELEFNDIRITNVREDDSDLYTRRVIRISKGLARRLIVHYHFKKWPDHDCPENEMDLIKFINLIKTENVSSHPIVVHCSAGVGRTGTLIALDILMQQALHSKYLNIHETVKKLRYQRVKMVQTIEQYEFIYKSMAKFIQWKWPNRKNR